MQGGSEDVDDDKENFLSIFRADTFDNSFLFVIACTNFALGFRRILELAMIILLEHKFDVKTSEMTTCIGMMASPFCFKILMAIVTDNCALFKSKRKNYFILNSVVCIICIVMLMTFGVSFGKQYGKEFGKNFSMFCVVLS